MSDIDLLIELLERVKRLEARVKSLEEPKKAFEPPTIDQVRAYCKDRGNSVDPSQFVDFYTAKNWMVGKTKMKDWEASVRTWEKSVNEKKQETLGTNLVIDKVPENYGTPSPTALTFEEYKARRAQR